MAVGRAAPEFLASGEGVAQPGAGHEIGRGLLVDLEVAVEREQHEAVLLRVLPAPRLAMRKQAANDLRYQIALRTVADQGFQNDTVCAPVGMEHNLRAVFIRGRKMSRAGGLFGAVVQMMA